MANEEMLALVHLTKKLSENKTEQKIKINPITCPCCGAAIKKSHSVCEYCGLFLNIESNTDF